MIMGRVRVGQTWQEGKEREEKADGLKSIRGIGRIHAHESGKQTCKVKNQRQKTRHL